MDHCSNESVVISDSGESLSLNMYKSVYYCLVCIAVPAPVIPVIDIESDSSIIIQWNRSTNDAIVRYIVNVRKYVHVEPGKAKLEMVDAWLSSRTILAIVRNHTVESLSNISPINIGTFSL